MQQSAFASRPSPRVGSIGRRFSYTLIGVVTLVLIAFAAVGVFFNITIMERELETRLGNAMKLAQKSLPTPLWNLDSNVVNDFVEALFLDESIVYTKISWEEQVVTEKRRPGFLLQQIESGRPSRLLSGSEFIVKSSDIYFGENKVGKILSVMSRKTVQKQVLLQIYGIIALTLFIIAAIWVTCVIITRRYISRPLLKLQESASLIAQGDLNSFVDKSGRGEIGILAQHLDVMRGSIKRLFEELSKSKEKLEEHSRTLEQKVEVRTRELARSVEELKALGEVSQVVSSTLDLEAVLSSIVRNAVQLSKSDAGTIYEFDGAEAVFVPRTNYGVSSEFIEALRESELRVGDKTVLGQAVLKGAPDQVPDLVNMPDYPLSHLSHMQKAGFRAVLAVPLLREDRLIGGLVVRRKKAGEFPAPVVNLLQTFATQSVLAIENARLFREIEEKGRQLELANRHKSEFLSNMSHELRTPLNAIIGFSEVLLERMFGEMNEKQEDYLKDIHSSGQHLLSLINDILDLAKVEAGRMELNPTTFDLSAAIDNALTLIRERAMHHGIALATEIDSQLGELNADERKLKQILLNLLSNAVKFTPEGGRITVGARRLRDMVEIAVNDTGIGIAPKDQAAVFEEFKQVGRDYTRKAEGTGLGLALTRKLVELHGGVMRLESEPGKGSTFSFTLPLKAAVQNSIATSA
jgi:signal transduction histidine kinase/HAMP domain-containing protein